MSALNLQKMRRAVDALKVNEERHRRLMADSVYVAIMEGRACPLPLPPA